MEPLWDWDSENKMGYLDLSSKDKVISKTQKIHFTDTGMTVVIDFDADDNIIGIEVI